MEEVPATTKNLRIFGFAFVAVFILLAAFSGYVWKLENAGLWVPVFLILAMLFGIPSFFAPDALRPMYGPWMKMAFVLGAVMTTVLMTVLFIVVVPFFSLVRLKDPLRTAKSRDPSASFWEPHRNSEATVERFGRPF
jgi:hypothetical protein